MAEMEEWARLLAKAQRQVHGVARSKGWWDKLASGGSPIGPESVMSKLMLVVTEIAEAAEELRGGRLKTWHSGVDGGSKPEGFGIELADAVIRIFDLCEALGIDLGHCIHVKMEYNATRSHKHGGKVL